LKVGVLAGQERSQNKPALVMRVPRSGGGGDPNRQRPIFFARKGLTWITPYLKVRLLEIAMPTATLTSKGQITIPVDVRKNLKVDAGDRVEFVEVAPGRYEFVAATHSVTELKGMFGKPSRSIPIDEMNKAIARRGAAAR